MSKPYNVEALEAAHRESERGWSGFPHVIPELIEEIRRLRKENDDLRTTVRILWETTNA